MKFAIAFVLVAGCVAGVLEHRPRGGPRGGFMPAARGCPMAHCDPAMSDRVRMPVPAVVTPGWSDPSAASPDTGLGCSSNGVIAVCSLGGPSGPYLRAYDPDGNLLWHSGETLNSSAWTSAPMVDEHGGVIAADDAVLARFAPGGAVVWTSPTPGGTPISPTITANGVIVLATLRGPISAFDSRTGKLLGVLDLRDTLGGLPGRFETMNTPGVRGNRVYVSTEFKLEDGSADPNHHARLYAIDVDRTGPPADRLRVAWSYEFGARSGASPLVIEDLVIFDGDRLTPDGPRAPRFFALRDYGAGASLVWQYELGGPGAASAAHDPRGGAWVFALGDMKLVRLAKADGAVMQIIDLGRLTGEAGARPWSAMSIAEGPDGQPVLLAAARAPGAPYVVAVDLVAGTALWTHRMSDDVYGDLPRGQWPILATPDGGRVLVFTTRNGVKALAARP